MGYTRFTPDDIVLRAFNEPLTDRFFLKAERQEADHFSLFFSYGDKSLPELRALNFDDRDAFFIEHSVRRDTITYWLRDTTLVNQDTLNVELKYMATDTLGCLQPQTDTLQILAKQPYAKRLKAAQKEYEDWHKKQEKKRKRGEPYDSIMPPRLLTPEIKTGSSLDPDQDVRITFNRPLAMLDSSKIHLYARHDTLWYDTPLRIRPVEQRIPGDTVPGNVAKSLRMYDIRAAWQPDTEYSLEIDSLAFMDIYGLTSPKLKQGLKVKSLDEYSSLVFRIPQGKGENIVVELLNQQDAAVKRVNVVDGTAQFFYITPGTYYARLFYDDNNNGVWDTGNYAEGRQPELTCYYTDEIECKAKWDITLDWNPKARRAEQQKPAKITKQKAEQQRKVQQRNLDRARKMGIPYPF